MIPIKYNELVEISKNFNLDFHLEIVENDSIKLSNSYHPWSIKEEEANIIYDTIINNNLKYGYEIATAFGISASIIGLALNKTNGKLLTLDSYIEEKFGHCNSYNISTKSIYENASGYKMAKELFKFLKKKLHTETFVEEELFLIVSKSHSLISNKKKRKK